MERTNADIDERETDPLINKPPSDATDTHSAVLSSTQRQHSSSTLSVVLILVAEIFENLTLFSVVAGMVLFCTSHLGIEQVMATNLNLVFAGFVFIMPVLGGFVSDSYVERYKTTVIAGVIYIAGLLLLPASAVNFSDLGWTEITMTQRRALFFLGLLLIAIGVGGVKACIGPFGAEQIEHRGKEAVQSYFNWLYWMINVGALLASTLVGYVQQEITFTWGFFIPALSMVLAAFIFVLGQSKYKRTQPEGSILAITCGICAQGACKSRPEPNFELPEGSERKMLARSKKSFGGNYDDGLVDGVVCVVKVAPFCALMVLFWALNSQMTNTFFAQAERMDVRLGNGVNMPASALGAANTLGIIILIPVIDKVVYPFFERIGHPLTPLRKAGIGLVLAAVGVTVAGIVEIYRKKVLYSDGGSHTQVLAGETFTASNMSVLWLVPQYILIGMSEIFASITIMEFVYTQAPVSMQGLLTGLFFASIGVGQWVSTSILSTMESVRRNDPWWSSDINNAKMENLMFLLAGLMIVNTVVFCVVAHFYTYQDPSQFEAEGTQQEDKGCAGSITSNRYGQEDTDRESSSVMKKSKDTHSDAV